MARRRVWAFGFGHIAGCEAPAGPHGPQKQMASTVTYWAICASASNSLTRDAHVTDDTARHLRYTSRAKREAKSRCRTVAPWSTTMRRVFHPETNGVKASPHRHKRVLSHGAPADPSDPWNIHAAPVSP